MVADPVRARYGAGAAPGASPADEKRRLREVCQEFEAFLVRELFKELRKSAVFGDEASGGRPVGSNIQTGIADDRFAEWVSHSGGLGLGKMLFDSLVRQMVIDNRASD